MGKGFFQVPVAVNEPVKSYAPGSPEREAVLQQYRKYYKSKTEVPLYIGEHEVAVGDTRPISPPHDHKHIVGHYYLAEPEQDPGNGTDQHGEEADHQVQYETLADDER